MIHPGALYSEGLSRILSTTNFNVNYVLSSPDGVPLELASEPCLLFIIGGRGPTALANDAQVIAQKFRLARIVIIGDDFEMEGVILALEAGARGYLSDNISSEALVKSLELVMLDEAVLPAEFARGLQKHLAHFHEGSARIGKLDSEPKDQRLPALSSREQAILKKLALGLSNKVIAYELAITEATVKVHVKSILRKIQARNRTQAAIWAVLNRAKFADDVGEAKLSHGEPGNGGLPAR